MWGIKKYCASNILLDETTMNVWYKTLSAQVLRLFFVLFSCSGYMFGLVLFEFKPDEHQCCFHLDDRHS